MATIDNLSKTSRTIPNGEYTGEIVEAGMFERNISTIKYSNSFFYLKVRVINNGKVVILGLEAQLNRHSKRFKQIIENLNMIPPFRELFDPEDFIGLDVTIKVRNVRNNHQRNSKIVAMY